MIRNDNKLRSKWPYPWEVAESEKTFVSLPSELWESQGRAAFARPSCYGVGRVDVGETSYLVLIGVPSKDQKEWIMGNTRMFADDASWRRTWTVQSLRQQVAKIESVASPRQTRPFIPADKAGASFHPAL